PHLAECPACRERLAEARALIARADALLALALPAERSAPPLHERRRRPRWRRVRWPIAWAASVTLAVGLGWMLRGRENRALVASAERDTLPQMVAMDQSREEPRPAPLVRAPASRTVAPRQEAQGAAERGRADSAAPASNAASGVVPIVTPSIAASDRAPALKPATPAAADSIAGRAYEYQRQRAAELRRVERLARFVGPLRVEIAGPLGTDSLSKLLELVK